MSPTPATAAVEALVGRLQASATHEEVMSFATELGHLFAERPLESAQARGLRLDLLRAANKRDDASAVALNGFVSFLVAYEASRQSGEQEADAAANLDEVDWEILRRLSRQPVTPSELAGGRDNGKMSRRLTELESRELIVPCTARDGRSRPRELTPLGHLVVARATDQVATKELRNEYSPAALAVSTPPSSLLSSLISRSVESALRTLKSILVNSDRTPMHRREVEASFAPELRGYGFLEAFEYHVEAFGLADIDENDCFWSTTSNPHADRWTQLITQLRDNRELCQRVFSAQADETYTFVTVSERQEQWRQVLSVLAQRVDVHTVESLNHVTRDDTAKGTTSLIVDDSTLATKVARNYSSKLFTLERKPGVQEPVLRRLGPASISAPT